ASRYQDETSDQRCEMTHGPAAIKFTSARENDCLHRIKFLHSMMAFQPVMRRGWSEPLKKFILASLPLVNKRNHAPGRGCVSRILRIACRYQRLFAEDSYHRAAQDQPTAQTGAPRPVRHCPRRREQT